MRYTKRKTPPNGFTVMQDDREKHPWSLPFPVEVKRLKVGDYTIKGFEDRIAIEKKSGLGELFKDLVKGYRPTFVHFLEKLSSYPVRCIIVEEPLSDWRVRAELKRIQTDSSNRCRMIPRTIYYWVGEIMMTYGVPILFVDPGTKDIILPEVFRAAQQKARELG